MTCRTSLALEQLALDELPATDAATLRREQPDLALRLAALQRSNEAVLERYTPAEVATEIRRRLSTPESVTVTTSAPSRRQAPARPSRSWPIWLAPAGALAAALLLFAIVPQAPDAEVATPGAELERGIRTKGLDPYLLAFRQTDGGGSERLNDQAVVRESDVIQLRLVGAGRRYGAVLSIDGRGVITGHLPNADRAERAAALKREGAQTVPDAYELDDAPEFERFVLVTSAEPFDLALLHRAAADLAADAGGRRDGTLRLPGGMEQTWLNLRKVAP